MHDKDFYIMKYVVFIGCLAVSGTVAKAESKDLSVLRWLTADDSSAVVEPLINIDNKSTLLKSNRFVEPVSTCKLVNAKDFIAQVNHCKSTRQGWLKI